MINETRVLPNTPDNITEKIEEVLLITDDAINAIKLAIETTINTLRAFAFIFIFPPPQTPPVHSSA